MRPRRRDRSGTSPRARPCSGAQLWLALFNPFADDAIVDIGFLTNAGPLAPGTCRASSSPATAGSRVPVHDHARRDDLVATEVNARRGRVVAEQSQMLDGTDGRRGLALSLGAPRALAPVGVRQRRRSSPGRTETLVLANPDVAADERDDPHPARRRRARARDREPPGAHRGRGRPRPARPGRRRVLGRGRRSPVPVVAESLVARPLAGRRRAARHRHRRSARAPRRAPLGRRRRPRDPRTSQDLVAVLNPGRRAVDVPAPQSRARGRRTTPPDTRAGPARARASGRVIDLGRAQCPPETRSSWSTPTGPVVVDRESSAMPGLTVAGADPRLDR